MERTAGSLTFRNPLVFGGGTCKTITDVSKAATTDVGGIEIGTITPKMRSGNEGPNVFYAHFVNGVLLFTLNSLGLPNPGKEIVTTFARHAIELAHDAGKLIGCNVAADTPEEIVEMILWAINLNFDWVTINASCPNKFDSQGQPLAILSFDLDDTERFLELLEKQVGGNAGEIWWKPSPFTDTIGMLRKSASLIAHSNVITGYIANNTVPHCFQWGDDEKPTITPGGGLAGMGGPAVKPIAMGHLQILASILPQGITRIGAGGVTYGQDIADYIGVGASIVHATSAIWANTGMQQVLNYGTANYILAEFAELPNIEAICSAV